MDMVNVMLYDLMNRRDKVTNHYISVTGSLNTIKAYKEVGLDTMKINLGFVYYAKWFMTDPDSNCGEHPIRCTVAKLESPDGTDPGKSSALTFEKSNMGTVLVNLSILIDETCGFTKQTRCPPNLCCS
jgi:chitinase